MIVYKVVRTKGRMGRLVSLIVIDRKVILKYRINKETKPKIGKIFAFSNLRDAKHFAEAFQGYLPKILECSAENVKPIKFLAGFAYHEIVSQEFELFWENYFRIPLKDRLTLSDAKIQKYIPCFVFAPEGSVCVDSLTPKKVVEC